MLEILMLKTVHWIWHVENTDYGDEIYIRIDG